MSDMVERVGRAMCWVANGRDNDCNTECLASNECRGPLSDCYVRDARAAIEAMRGATIPMIEAGGHALLNQIEGSEAMEAGVCWGAMITAALTNEESR